MTGSRCLAKKMIMTIDNSPLNLPDDFLGLYLHIPFCLSKCYYCDFVSMEKGSCGSGDIDTYLKALKEEAESKAVNLRGRKVNSLYIGGGTPSILSLKEVDFLFNEIISLFDIDNNAERTIELNPRTINTEKLSLITNHTNRLSLGVQSFNDDELKAIGRAHSGEDARHAIELIKSFDIDFSLDIIFGLPDQNTEVFKDSLHTAITYNPSHISLYSLMLVQGTKMYSQAESGEIIFPSEEKIINMWDVAEDMLEENNYQFYEVSNASKPECFSRHNLAYWLEREYIGLGLSASSYYNNFRFKNTITLDKYIKNSAHSTVYAEKISNNDLLFEGLMTGLRLKNGFDTTYIENKTKLKYQEDLHTEILRKGNTLRLSKKGFRTANQVILQTVLND